MDHPSEKTAFITGVTGQDGAHPIEALIEKGHVVRGIKCRASSFKTGRDGPAPGDRGLRGPDRRPGNHRSAPPGGNRGLDCGGAARRDRSGGGHGGRDSGERHAARGLHPRQPGDRDQRDRGGPAHRRRRAAAGVLVHLSAPRPATDDLASASDRRARTHQNARDRRPGSGGESKP